MYWLFDRKGGDVQPIGPQKLLEDYYRSVVYRDGQ